MGVVIEKLQLSCIHADFAELYIFRGFWAAILNFQVLRALHNIDNSSGKFQDLKIWGKMVNLFCLV